MPILLLFLYTKPNPLQILPYLLLQHGTFPELGSQLGGELLHLLLVVHVFLAYAAFRMFGASCAGASSFKYILLPEFTNRIRRSRITTVVKFCNCSYTFVTLLIMELKLNLNFEQLLELVKQLPARQIARLKAELPDTFIENKLKQEEPPVQGKPDRLMELIMNGPVLTDEEANAILDVRRELNDEFEERQKRWFGKE